MTLALDLLKPTSSFLSARRFKYDRYVCQHTANIPENIKRYCGIMKVKLNAVTAGHSFNELTMLSGTACVILRRTPEGGSPDKIACMPKK